MIDKLQIERLCREENREYRFSSYLTIHELMEQGKTDQVRLGEWQLLTSDGVMLIPCIEDDSELTQAQIRLSIIKDQMGKALEEYVLANPNVSLNNLVPSFREDTLTAYVYVRGEEE